MSRSERRIDPAHGPLRVALAGDFEHADFANLRDELGFQGQISLVASADQADWILLCEARPGAIAQSEVEAIFAREPAVRIALVTGSHCEGELRSGDPLQGVERWRWWEARFRLLDSLTAPPPPRTLSNTERVIRIIPAPSESNEVITVAVCAANREAGEAIVDLLNQFRIEAFRVLAHESPRSADVLVWCDDDLSRPELIERAAFARRQFAHAGAIAVIDFPRTHERDIALKLGYSHCLGRPFFAGDLLRAVREAVTSSFARFSAYNRKQSDHPDREHAP